MSAQSSGNKPNAFEIMMSAACKAVLPPPYETSSEQTLRSDHVSYCIRKIWGGAQILSQVLVEILLKDSLIVCGAWIHVMNNSLLACHTPPIFSEFKGFNDKTQKNHKYLKQL